MQIFKKPNFKFMKYKFIALAISAIVIGIGWTNIIGGKGLNTGVDFAGGTLVQIRFISVFPIEQLRQSLGEAGLGSSKIQEVEKGEREYIIRTMLPEDALDQELEAHVLMGNMVVNALKTQEDQSAVDSGLLDLNVIERDALRTLIAESFPEQADASADAIINLRQSSELKGIIENFDQLAQTGIDNQVLGTLKDKTFLGSMTIKRRETVGPQVGQELREKATQATVWALIGMLIYIGIRFKFAYGVAAILTLAHDVLVTIGIFSLTNREINLPVIAAIMTIVGYSLNDTIVIFDRVRDNLKTLRKLDFSSLLDASINQTLSRTVITSGTTLLTVVTLFIFGGEVINDFAFTMIIGVITGTYSSIYMSCSLLTFWKKIFKPKKGLGR
ncbi:MAG: protein translocase subunit SecF [Candidatus Aminicenantes bacterium]|nr:MAG: protein translocase subunit SecF [Candidatus Aminicenantes bacterium]